MYCTNLNSIVLPNSITAIGSETFSSCENLTSIVIPNSVTSIGYVAFMGCSNLESVEIGNSVTVIEDNAFVECRRLRSIVIPNSVTKIGFMAFANCDCLESIEIGNSVSEIGENAFEECWSLGAVYINDLAAWCNIKFGMEKSNPLGFAHNLYLNNELVTDLVIPNTVTSIAERAFEKCWSLTSVVIPNSVTSIGYGAFYDCDKLKSVYINDLAAWCNIKFGWDGNPLNYAHNLYIDNKLVKDIVIPGTVTSIEKRAFEKCWSLTSVVIPRTVNRIDDNAFTYCKNLTSIRAYKQNPDDISLGTNVFVYTNSVPPEACTLYVPQGSKGLYQAASQWDSFQNIQEFAAATGIVLNETALEIQTGGTLQLTATAIPASMELEAVAWASSNTDVATVDVDGLVTAMGVGDATITATDIMGHEANCQITVVPPPYSLYVEIQDVKASVVNMIPVMLHNEGDVVSFNCDIILPEGVSVTRDAGGRYAIELSERSEGCSIASSDITGGVRVVCYSNDNTPLTGTDGAIFYIPLEVAADIETGTELPVLIKETSITHIENSALEEITAPNTSAILTVIPNYRPGDVNGDGKFTAIDISLAVEFVLGNAPRGAISKAADMNGDGRHTAIDISMIVAHILNGAASGGNNAPKRGVRTFANSRQGEFTLENITGAQGATISLPVGMNNAGTNIVSFNCDIILPEGVTVETNTKGAPIATLSDRKDDHVITGSVRPDGVVRIVSYSAQNSPYLGESGVVFTSPIVLNAPVGTYTIRITNATMACMTGGELSEIICDEATATLTITEPASQPVVEDYQLYARDIIVEAGEKTAVLQVGLNNPEAIKNFSCDIVLPTGVSVNYDNTVEYYNIVNVNRLTNDVEGEYAAGTSNVFHVSYASGRGKSIESGDGVLFNVVLDIDSNAGQYDITLANQTVDGEGSADFTAKLTVKGAVPTEVNLMDEIAYNGTQTYDNVKVTYTRNFETTAWQPLYVPFSMDYEDWADKAEVAYINNVHQYDDDENGTVDRTILEFIRKKSGSIEANKPYVIKPLTTGEVAFTAESTTLKAAPETDGFVDCMSTTTKYTLYGTYQEKTDMYANGYYAMSGGNFMQASSESVKLSPFRTYLKIESRNGGNGFNAPRKVRVVVDGVMDDEATAVEGLTIEQLTVDHCVYNLAGQKVDCDYKGIVINNGRKVLRK